MSEPFYPINTSPSSAAKSAAEGMGTSPPHRDNSLPVLINGATVLFDLSENAKSEDRYANWILTSAKETCERAVEDIGYTYHRTDDGWLVVTFGAEFQ